MVTVKGIANTMAYGRVRGSLSTFITGKIGKFPLEFSELEMKFFLIQVHGHPEFYP